ncbi:hypothetical protein C8R43DRAFT_1242842 [Mycena crocata]|nr:hypothetical protein C8R43DRAFT_1242842 [Mycena crocata]
MSSTINLSPASAAFVNTRTTSLGPWVMGAFLDCFLMGVISCQTVTYFRTRRYTGSTLQRYYRWVVVIVVLLSLLKTAQAIGTVWIQNVVEFANPDVARRLVAKAWWQVSFPLMTGIIGAIVQSFFCLRFYVLSSNWKFCVPIICAICLGLVGVCLQVANILWENAQAKVIWLVVHLVGVAVADILITTGTIYSLRKRDSGLERTTTLINRLVRLVFESAVPPAVLATWDLILTKTLGPHLLWHLFVNIALGKVYVVSLLYTLNTINEYRARKAASEEIYSHGWQGRISRHTNVELSARSPTKTDQIFVQTEVSTDISPMPFSPMHSRYPGSTLENGRYSQGKDSN